MKGKSRCDSYLDFEGNFGNLSGQIIEINYISLSNISLVAVHGLDIEDSGSDQFAMRSALSQ
jgi:hypothetical protein